ncbi:copper amine oxidase-like protein [Paenibacillus taihuensis]|uniref:Copper amine oxidase-like protein n=1 Tax=Paenibacillus taihuensis TaxID=1156355 RepID=A0A3D9S8R3_9BACL|nr:stalk domain-containing protein [Paenibacillus taihuensis]REE89105.1 copper amine oxidase-like protein [Paenibacillus taihuensis]
MYPISRRLRSALIAFLLVTSIALLLPMTVLAAKAAETTVIKVTMNGKSFTPKSSPYMDSGTIYLPLRDMGELLGTTVAWVASANSALLNYPNLSIKLQVGSEAAIVNGKELALPAPMQVVEGRIYVPLRFLSEATGADVKWDAEANTVRISRSEEYFKQGLWYPSWLNRKTGEIYMTKDEQTPVSLLGKLEGTLQGTVSYRIGGFSSDNLVLTVIDKVGDQYTSYGLLVHNRKIVAQQKAVYQGHLETNANATQVLISGAWQPRYFLSDGRDVTVYDENAKPIESYDLPKLFGKDDVYGLQGVGFDFVAARPMGTGLLMLYDKKDNSVVVLADKLLTGDELKYVHTNKEPYPGDTLSIAGDRGYGQLDLFYTNPLESNTEVLGLTYFRPSYEKEREQLPKSKPLKELAASCSPETVKSVGVQEGDMGYLTLIGANPDDRASISKVCTLLSKFVQKGETVDVPSGLTEGFFHGMSISFSDGVSEVEIAEGTGLTIEQGNGKALVLRDEETYELVNELKVLPPPLAIKPNPVHFGEKLEFAGNNGVSEKESPLVVRWVPIRMSYSSSDPDPSLIIYKSKAKYGKYSVDFIMPAYGTAVDGTLRPIPPGKGFIEISGDTYIGSGSHLRADIELKPASSVFLSVNGVPVVDSASAPKPLTEKGLVYIPVRMVAKLSGQSVTWDAKTRSLLINGKEAEAELAPIVRSGIAYVPIRAVTAVFGLPVVWDSASRSVNITVNTTAQPVKE